MLILFLALDEEIDTTLVSVHWIQNYCHQHLNLEQSLQTAGLVWSKGNKIHLNNSLINTLYLSCFNQTKKKEI